LRCAKRE